MTETRLVSIEFPFGYCEEVPSSEARARIEASAMEDTSEYPIIWERDDYGDVARQQNPYFRGEMRFVGRIYAA